MKSIYLTNKKGFTLIELLVATTIVVILMSVGVVAYTQAGKSARDAKRKTDMETLRQAMTLYRSDAGVYPSSGSMNPYAIVVDELVQNDYLSAPAPSDPQDPNPRYEYNGSASTFCFCAEVENPENGNSSSLTCDAMGNTGQFYCAKGS